MVWELVTSQCCRNHSAQQFSGGLTGDISAIDQPFTFVGRQTFSLCATSMPFDFAQPEAAGVGVPDASNAADTAGPRFQPVCQLVCRPVLLLSVPDDEVLQTIARPDVPDRLYPVPR